MTPHGGSGSSPHYPQLHTGSQMMLQMWRVHMRALDLLKQKVATFSDQVSCTQDDHKKARNIKAACWREELEGK